MVLNAGLQLTARVGRAKGDFGELNLCRSVSPTMSHGISEAPGFPMVNSASGVTLSGDFSFSIL